MKKTIYILGNFILKKDSLPIKLLPKLTKGFPRINFVHFDPTEEIPILKNRELIILDTVTGIDRVTIISDINRFVLSPRVSLHDYDLPLELGLLKKLKRIRKYKIIGIPDFYKPDKALNELKNILTTI